MAELEKLTEYIISLSKENSLCVEESKNGIFRISSDNASGVTLFLQVKSPNDFSFYFLVRTYDVVYSGDRTDIHVVISLIFASFLKYFNSDMSCSLIDIPHPILPNEIWGRYIMPDQTPLLWGISDWDKLTEVISKIITTVGYWKGLFWSVAECPCENCLRENGIEGENYKKNLPIELIHSKNKLLKPSTLLNYGGRIRPNFSYFYDIKNEITIIKSETLSKFLTITENLSNNKIEIVEGIKGKFILQGELKNFIADKYIVELKKTYKALGINTNSENLRIYPLENMFLSASYPYIVALGCLCGIYKFKVEKESLRVRHNQESKLIFPISQFEWVEDVSPEQFEGLIKALLEREPNIVSVRKVSPTNQADEGRDLVIEWIIRNENVVSNIHPPNKQIRVVGQCKSSIKPIGKNKVLDIRDTVESHCSEGFFLAVSTQLTASLTKKLEELQVKGIWTEWWNRDDIEIRLSKNQDLLPLFPLVVRAKHRVKFVEQD